MLNFGTEFVLFENFGRFGYIFTIIYVLFLINSYKNSINRKSYFSFFIVFVYYFIFYFLTQDCDRLYIHFFNFFWFVPIIISIIYEIVTKRKYRIENNSLEQHIENNEQYNKTVDVKNNKNAIIYGVITIVFILFIFFPSIWLRFWYSNGEIIFKTIQGDFYNAVGLYDKAFDAYKKIDYIDNIYEKVEKNYEKGIKYYFDTKQYKKCIEFYNKINKEYYYSDKYNAPWLKYDFDYEFESYKKLYEEYKNKNEKKELFGLINEIKNKYDNKTLTNAGFDFNEDFNNYESILYMDENTKVLFGNIGMSEAGLTNLKRPVEWKLLYEDNNKLYLLCNTILVNRYYEEIYIDNLKYTETDMYNFLNNFLYKEMFNDDEKDTLLPIDDDKEYVSLLSEEIIDKMYEINKIDYLNKIISEIPLSWLADKNNSGSLQKIWLKSDIVKGKAEYISGFYNKPRISSIDSTNNIINVLPVICVDKKKIENLAELDRKKYNDEKLEKQKIEQKEKILEIKKENRFDLVLKEKINKMKKVTEYKDNQTIDDFDTLLFGDVENSGWSGGAKGPISWILLDKTENKALLLSKYSLYNSAYDVFNKNYNFSRLNESYHSFTNFDEFNDNEKKHIIDTRVTISKNNKFPQNNDLGSVNAKLFFLSIDDIKKYFSDENGSILNNKLKTICDGINDDYSNEIGWWLRDIGETYWTVAYIDENGNLNERGMLKSNSLIGYRLAMWISY